MFHFANTLQQF